MSTNVKLKVEGMTCMGCVKTVTEALETAPGVDQVSVDLESGMASMTYAGDASVLLDVVLKEAGKVAHLVNEEKRIQIKVDGMTCMGCVKTVTEALQSVQGVDQVSVDLESGMATMTYAGDAAVLVHAVLNKAGKVAHLVDREKWIDIKVDGMTCMGCVKTVTEALESVQGVDQVSVDLESGMARMQYAGEAAILVHAVLNQAGKVAHLVDGETWIDIKVDGMTCMGCVKTVTEALQSVQGVDQVSVDLESGMARMKYAGDAAVLVHAVLNEAGKVARVVSGEKWIDMKVEGMTCMGCVNRVKDSLEGVAGVGEVDVSLEKGMARFKFEGQDDSLLVEAVKNGAGKVAYVLDGKDGGSGLHEADEGFSNVSEAGVEDKSVDIDILAEKAGALDTGTTVSESMTTTQLRIGGMTCSSCVGVVEGVLSKVPGVETARVNLLAGRASVIHDTSIAVAQTLASAVASAGYKCHILETGGEGESEGNLGRSNFRIVFQTDVQAQNALKVLRFMNGVKSVECVGRTASISLDKGFPKSVVLRVLESDGVCGKMIVKRSLKSERAADARGDHFGATEVIDEEAFMWKKLFFLSVSFLAPIMAIGIAQGRTHFLPMRLFQWIHFALATPVQFVCGRGFYRASYFAMKKKRATMDVLVALSTSIAYFSSVFVVLLNLGGSGDKSLGHATMFNVSAMIITMVLLGKWVEAQAKRRAAAGVAALSALAPEDAILYDEREGVSCHTEVSVNLLEVGDVVRLLPGDRVPTDGEVTDGISAIDESMLTGESNPVPKGKGDFVYGGTLNGGGSMLIRTTAIGSDAVLSQIVKLVNDAQTSRAPIESFADRVSAVFVPAVVCISCLVFVGWYGAAIFGWIPEEWTAEEGPFFFALLFALETMVIACPCALGLATPTAVMVASEMGAKLGVLFRGGGAAIEAANNIETVFFDKTGTLTMGKPEVAAVLIAEHGSNTVEQASVIISDLILLVESQSHHPLASAIARYLDARSGDQSESNRAAYKLESVEELPGRGMKAVVNNGEYQVRVGSRSWALGEDGVLERQLLTPSEIAQISRMESEDGLTMVAAVVNNSMVAIYGLEDTVRPEAESVVSYLQSRLHVDCHIITGDSQETGRAVARQVGIPAENLLARAMPWTKVDVIKSLAEGTGCFVGDGINDAPALAAAALGVAIGAGAPVAAESASVVLVRSDLRGIVDALTLAKATFRRVRLNFIWAIGYNMLGIPLAAGVLYPLFRVRVPPLVASGAMALSSTSVVVSSLWLRRFKPPKIDSSLLESGQGAVQMRSRKVPSTFEIGDDVDSPSNSGDNSWNDVDEPLLEGTRGEQAV